MILKTDNIEKTVRMCDKKVTKYRRADWFEDDVLQCLYSILLKKILLLMRVLILKPNQVRIYELHYLFQNTSLASYPPKLMSRYCDRKCLGEINCRKFVSPTTNYSLTQCLCEIYDDKLNYVLSLTSQ